MDVKVEKSTLDAALQEAVLRALGENGRELIIREAIAYLTKEEDRGYGSSKQPSKLRMAMETAAEKIAHAVFTEKLESDPEFKRQVALLYEDACKKFFNVETREKLVDKLADKMSRAFTEERY
jgi:hypothetical protein